MIIAFQPRPRPLVKHEKPVRDKKYLAWVRSFPCAVCGTRRRVEAAHTGDHGISTKAADLRAIPLCRDHHKTGKDAYHKGRAAFEAKHGLDIEKLIERMNRIWQRNQTA